MVGKRTTTSGHFPFPSRHVLGCHDDDHYDDNSCVARNNLSLPTSYKSKSKLARDCLHSCKEMDNVQFSSNKSFQIHMYI